MRIAAQAEGIDEAIRRLQEVGANLKKAQPKALRAGAKILAEQMKKEVNVSDIDHVHIRDDIKVRQTPKKERVYADAVSY
ncbi:HK97 gp10 family phage protein, partial [Bacillus stratosphericus]